ncbi:MAG: LapA family protein [Gammaproteobacteria bacterium]|nr:LapA family protein [Gammaproteobacteria bacterium]
MRFIFLILLIALFGYSLALVIYNHASNPQVELVFATVPAMNLGILLVITLMLGVITGLLLGVFVFRVVQTRWEIGRLNKELELVRARHIQAAAAAAAATATAAASATTQIQKTEEIQTPPPVV